MWLACYLFWQPLLYSSNIILNSEPLLWFWVRENNCLLSFPYRPVATAAPSWGDHLRFTHLAPIHHAPHVLAMSNAGHTKKRYRTFKASHKSDVERKRRKRSRLYLLENATEQRRIAISLSANSVSSNRVLRGNVCTQVGWSDRRLEKTA
jgi:hypothetical protein